MLFSATFERPSAPVVLYHKNSAHKRSYLIASLKEEPQPSHQADKKHSWQGLLSNACPSCNLVRKQYESTVPVLGIGASRWPWNGHIPIQAAALLWLYWDGTTQQDQGRNCTALLVPPHLASEDCFGFEENLIYHRYIQGFIRHWLKCWTSPSRPD